MNVPRETPSKLPSTPLAPKKAKKAMTAANAARAKRLATDTKDLNVRQNLFTSFYLSGPTAGNATASAIAAGYSQKTAYAQGSLLLKHPEVSKALANAQAGAAKRAEITASQVLQEWWEIAQADPNELVENRRVCCRYCYGKDHEYQWTTREFQKAQEHYAEAQESWAEREEKYRRQYASKEPKPPEVGGGFGWDPRKSPVETCPDCFGEGELRTFVKDSRNLSPAARRLFAGIETTKDGVKVKTHDQAAARNNVAKFLGMLADRHIFSDLKDFDYSTATREQLEDIAQGREPRK